MQPINLKKTIFFLITALPLLASANISTPDSILKSVKFRFGLDGGYYYYEVQDKTVLLPALLQLRRANQSNLKSLWGLNTVNNIPTLTDNPLQHGAGFLTFNAACEMGKKFDILASITGEHRGTSYGVYNTANMIVFPQFRFRYHDTLPVQRQKISITASIGNFNNIRTDEGLTYYNIDIQALVVKIGYRNFTYEHLHVADLVYSIGTNIDDAVSHYVYYHTNATGSGSYWRFGVGYDINDQVYGPVYLYLKNFYNLSAAKIIDSTARVYMQLGHLDGSSLVKANTFAFLAGMEKRISNRNFKLYGRVEFRYYGNDFKSGFYNSNVYYRSLNSGIFPNGYGNTIGTNLYPMKNYERPFSQFAVFTEQRLNPYSVYGATLYLNAAYRVYNELFFELDADINYIGWFLPQNNIEDDVNKSASFTFPFFKAGFYFEPAKNLKLFAGITNKAMNLDNTYQTFYLLKSPCIYFELIKTVDGFLER
jgi:hypothetical protein